MKGLKRAWKDAWTTFLDQQRAESGGVALLAYLTFKYFLPLLIIAVVVVVTIFLLY